MVPGRPPLGRPGVGVLSLAALVLLGGCDLWPRHNPKDRRCNSGSCSRPEAGAPDLGADADLGPADLGHDRGADAPAVTPDRGADAPDMIPDLPGPDATPDQQPKLDTGCSVCPDGGCSGCVWTLAGTGQKGSHDDIASKATFNFPEYIALDKAGKLYVVDQENHSIRVVHAGKVTTLTGQAGKGHLNGTLKASKFDTPKGIVVASNGKIYVSDHGNNVIRKISISGDKVETVAGVQGLTGTKDGLAIKALFNKPRGLAMAIQGDLLVADTVNHCIRGYFAGAMSTYAGQCSPSNGGFHDGPATGKYPIKVAQFMLPMDLATDGTGNVYIADSDNKRIRVIDHKSKVVSTWAGGTSGPFVSPRGVAVGANGVVYVADHVTRQVYQLVSGKVTGQAGLKSSTNKHLDGKLDVARFGSLTGIVVDASGRVLITDPYHHVIRAVRF